MKRLIILCGGTVLFFLMLSLFVICSTEAGVEDVYLWNLDTLRYVDVVNIRKDSDGNVTGWDNIRVDARGKIKRHMPDDLNLGICLKFKNSNEEVITDKNLLLERFGRTNLYRQNGKLDIGDLLMYGEGELSYIRLVYYRRSGEDTTGPWDISVVYQEGNTRQGESQDMYEIFFTNEDDGRLHRTVIAELNEDRNGFINDIALRVRTSQDITNLELDAVAVYGDYNNRYIHFTIDGFRERRAGGYSKHLNDLGGNYINDDLKLLFVRKPGGLESAFLMVINTDILDLIMEPWEYDNSDLTALFFCEDLGRPVIARSIQRERENVHQLNNDVKIEAIASLFIGTEEEPADYPDAKSVEVSLHFDDGSAPSTVIEIPRVLNSRVYRSNYNRKLNFYLENRADILQPSNPDANLEFFKVTEIRSERDGVRDYGRSGFLLVVPSIENEIGFETQPVSEDIEALKELVNGTNPTSNLGNIINITPGDFVNSYTDGNGHRPRVNVSIDDNRIGVVTFTVLDGDKVTDIEKVSTKKVEIVDGNGPPRVLYVVTMPVSPKGHTSIPEIVIPTSLAVENAKKSLEIGNGNILCKLLLDMAGWTPYQIEHKGKWEKIRTLDNIPDEWMQELPILDGNLNFGERSVIRIDYKSPNGVANLVEITGYSGTEPPGLSITRRIQEDIYTFEFIEPDSSLNIGDEICFKFSGFTLSVPDEEDPSGPFMVEDEADNEYVPIIVWNDINPNLIPDPIEVNWGYVRILPVRIGEEPDNAKFLELVKSEGVLEQYAPGELPVGNNSFIVACTIKDLLSYLSIDLLENTILGRIQRGVTPIINPAQEEEMVPVCTEISDALKDYYDLVYAMNKNDYSYQNDSRKIDFVITMRKVEEGDGEHHGIDWRDLLPDRDGSRNERDRDGFIERRRERKENRKRLISNVADRIHDRAGDRQSEREERRMEIKNTVNAYREHIKENIRERHETRYERRKGIRDYIRQAIYTAGQKIKEIRQNIKIRRR